MELDAQPLERFCPLRFCQVSRFTKTVAVSLAARHRHRRKSNLLHRQSVALAALAEGLVALKDLAFDALFEEGDRQREPADAAAHYSHLPPAHASSSPCQAGSCRLRNRDSPQQGGKAALA